MTRIHPDLEDLDQHYRKLLNAETLAAHSNGDLALAAALFVAPVRLYLKEQDDEDEFRFIDPWPFDAASDMRRTSLEITSADGVSLTAEAWRIRVLTMGAALAMAEVRRLQDAMERAS